MNAVLAIIADDGRLIIVIDREAVEINYILLYFIDSAKTLRQRPHPTPCEEAPGPGGAVCSSIKTMLLEGETAPSLGAALIKKYSSYRTNQKKVPHVFSPKLVPGDLKSLPDGWQTLLPSWPILSISFSSKIDPLGIECVTFVPHARDSGFTVERGQHFPVRL
jgi:hypothetical protein